VGKWQIESRNKFELTMHPVDELLQLGATVAGRQWRSPARSDAYRQYNGQGFGKRSYAVHDRRIRHLVTTARIRKVLSYRLNLGSLCRESTVETSVESDTAVGHSTAAAEYNGFAGNAAGDSGDLGRLGSSTRR
jgi:hypothetical protein